MHHLSRCPLAGQLSDLYSWLSDDDKLETSATPLPLWCSGLATVQKMSSTPGGLKFLAFLFSFCFQPVLGKLKQAHSKMPGKFCSQNRAFLVITVKAYSSSNTLIASAICVLQALF